MNHILLGVLLPFLVSSVVYLFRGLRASMRMLVITPLLMGGMAAWAVAPDIPRAVGAQELYLRLSFDPRCNVFLWHYSIDLVETDSVWWLVGLITIMICMLMAGLRELRIVEDCAAHGG
jgi:hypothetical protein